MKKKKLRHNHYRMITSFQQVAHQFEMTCPARVFCCSEFDLQTQKLGILLCNIPHVSSRPSFLNHIFCQEAKASFERAEVNLLCKFRVQVWWGGGDEGRQKIYGRIYLLEKENKKSPLKQPIIHKRISPPWEEGGKKAPVIELFKINLHMGTQNIEMHIYIYITVGGLLVNNARYFLLFLLYDQEALENHS